MKTRYLVLFVLGVVLPYWQFVPWLLAHGMDIGLFFSQLFVNRISSFFAFDVIISAIVLLAWIGDERGQHGVRHAWLAVVATVLIGVSAGLPLFLYLRQERE